MEEKIVDPNYHILLDMDGVLVDFIGGCAELFDTDLSDLTEWRVDKHLGISAKDFWGRIEQDKFFWANLNAYSWTRELVQTCQELTKGNVTILTSPSLDPNCAGQKAYWLAKNLPGFRRKFLIGPEKHLLAKPNHILVDDSESNCEKFQEAGGQAILFPRPWNSGEDLKDHEIVPELKKAITEIFVQKINED